MSTALDVLTTNPNTLQKVSFEPTTFEELKSFAKYISQSEMVPKRLKGKEADIVLTVMFGREIGVSAMQSLQGVACINGIPSAYGDLLLAVVQAHPDYVSHDEWFDGEGDNLTAHFVIQRRGSKPHHTTFSVADAKLAKLWDERKKVSRKNYKTDNWEEVDNDAPWHRYPKRMLQMRARVGMRDKFADALKGMKTTEEVMDYPENRESTIDARFVEVPPRSPEPPTRPTAPAVTQTDPSPTASTPGPEVISAAQVKQFGDTYKANGHTHNEAREYFKVKFGLDDKGQAKVKRSIDIPLSAWDDAIAWANTKAETKQEPNQEPNTTETSDDQEQATIAMRDVLGWTDTNIKQFVSDKKGDWADILREVKTIINRREER